MRNLLLALLLVIFTADAAAQNVPLPSLGEQPATRSVPGIQIPAQEQASEIFLPVSVKQKRSKALADRPGIRIRSKSQPPNTLAGHSAAVLANSTSANFPNINITSATREDQDEPSIAINPLDKNNLIVGANDYRSEKSLWAYHSMDGGRTWASQEMPWEGNLAFATDPAIAFNSRGIGFYTYGRMAASGFPQLQNEVLAFRTTNGGGTWSTPITVFADRDNVNGAEVLSDKYFCAADNGTSSPYRDNVYATWIEIQSERSRIVASRSTDDGVTWSPRVYLSGPSYHISPIPAVAPNGDVYITWVDQDSTVRKVYCARSMNGGLSYEAPVTVSAYHELGPLYPPGSTHAFPVIKGHLKVNSFPSIAVDHSTKKQGRIYITWTGAEQEGGRHHVYLAWSDDRGQSWTNPAAIDFDDSPSPRDKFFPWIAIDRSSGDVGVVYNDSRLDPENQYADLFMSFSSDLGANWNVRRISSESFNPTVSIVIDSSNFTFFGDYIGLAVRDSVWYPAWTDTRNAQDQEIYTALVRPYAPMAPENLAARDDTSGGSLKALVSWTYSPARNFGYALTSYQFLLERTGGLSVMLPPGTTQYTDATVTAGGVYEYRLRVVAAPGDSSGAVTVPYIPLASRKSVPPSVTAATSTSEGTEIEFYVAEKNLLGETVTGLDRLYFFADSALVDSLIITDAFRGSTKLRTLKLEQGFHAIQLAVRTNRNGIQTVSEYSSQYHLWAGDSKTAMWIDFDASNRIYTKAAWAPTTAAGLFQDAVLNDSLPYVAMAPVHETWFLVPSIRVSESTNAAKFKHIFVGGVNDLATVEYSTDAGFSFTTLRTFDAASHPESWKSDLAGSSFVTEVLSLTASNERDVVLRFRLNSGSTPGDGWFIDDLRFGNVLSADGSDSPRGFEVLSFTERERGRMGLRLEVRQPSQLRARVIDPLGRAVLTMPQTRVGVGEQEIEIALGDAGFYLVELEATGLWGTERIILKSVARNR